MLYDEAIRQIDNAINGMNGEVDTLDRVNSALIKAQELITELMASLDFERGGEIARSLFSLYMFFNQQLVDANIKKEAGPLKEVKSMLLELRSAWAQISDKNPPPDSEPGKTGVNIAG
jgi:flagellar protein FliS